MVFPSQANETKTAILRALEGYNSPEKGLGYNKLFDTVQAKVGGSRRTFHKYLDALVSSGAVRKEKDPRHKTGVVIYRTESATQDQILMEIAERIVDIEKIGPQTRAFWSKFKGEEAKIWTKALKLILLSDIVGRQLAAIEPISKPGWCAWGRVIKETDKEMIEIQAKNDDSTESVEFGFSLQLGKPVKMTVGRGVTTSDDSH